MMQFFTWMATIDLACSWTMNWNDPPKSWAAVLAAAAAVELELAAAAAATTTTGG